MSKRYTTLAVLLALVLGAGAFLAPVSAEAKRGDGPVIYVTSQDLYYDSIVTADPLPPNGPFQELRMGPNGLETDYGPGDPGYVGGRWVMETPDGPHYFSCPLLGPGREMP